MPLIKDFKFLVRWDLFEDGVIKYLLVGRGEEAVSEGRVERYQLVSGLEKIDGHWTITSAIQGHDPSKATIKWFKDEGREFGEVEIAVVNYVSLNIAEWTAEGLKRVLGVEEGRLPRAWAIAVVEEMERAKAGIDITGAAVRVDKLLR